MVSPAQPNHWLDRRVFITGATGLVGGWILERLLQLGADPICLVRDHVPRARANVRGDTNRATVVRGELEDFALLERTLNEYEISTVLHLAAQSIVGIANSNPLSTFESNVRGTWNLLEACRRSSGIESVVIASSDKAYGDSPQLPYDESFALRGTHPYDVSKSCADLIAASYFESFGLPVSITRCGNFYGPGDLNWNRLVPGTIRSVIRGEAPVVRSDGLGRRDYIYVEDAAQAYLHLAEATACRTAVHGESFNFSNEDPKTSLEIVNLILELEGRTDLQPQVLDRATNEIRHQFLSAQKARDVLGWTPGWSLEAGLRRTLPWYRDHLAGLTPTALAVID